MPSKSLEHFSQKMQSFSKARTSIAKASSQPLWVEAMRDEAFGILCEKGLPTTRDEDWKYTSLRSLNELSFDVLSEDDAEALKNQPYHSGISLSGCRLAFQDGVFLPNHSDLSALGEGVIIKDLETALLEDETMMQQAFKRSDLKSDSPFYLLNQACIKRGLYIQVTKNQKVTLPIHLLFKHSGRSVGDSKLSSFPRIVIAIGDHAEVDFIETHLGEVSGEGNAYLTNSVLNVLVGVGAHMGYFKIQRETDKAFHFGSQNIVLNENAQLDTFVLAMGAALSRNDLNVYVNGAGAKATLDGLYLLKGQQHVDNHTMVMHRNTDSESSQSYKGILGDASRGVFNGKVLVQKKAQRTKAFQINKNLLLSKSAEINTKPELQIDADDVKCNHGATVGQLNPEEIFYLLSRGITKKDAEIMLSRAFADEVVMNIKNVDVRRQVEAVLDDYFN